MIEKRKSSSPAQPDRSKHPPSAAGVAGHQGGQKSRLAAGRNPRLTSQRRKALGKHYRAKFIAGRSGRR